jgi:hypothetical protein
MDGTTFVPIRLKGGVVLLKTLRDFPQAESGTVQTNILI